MPCTEYKVTLNGKEYGLPVIKITDKLSIAVFDMLSSVQLAKDASLALFDKLKESDIDISKIDTVLSAETKGIILAYQISEYLNSEMVVLRKNHKIYHPEITKAAVNTYTTENEHYLYLDNNQLPKLTGKNVLIVDDVVSTGSSLAAIEKILESAGANIRGKAFVFAEGDASKRDDIVFVDSLPLL